MRLRPTLIIKVSASYLLCLTHKCSDWASPSRLAPSRSGPGLPHVQKHCPTRKMPPAPRFSTAHRPVVQVCATTTSRAMPAQVPPSRAMHCCTASRPIKDIPRLIGRHRWRAPGSLHRQAAAIPPGERALFAFCASSFSSHRRRQSTAERLLARPSGHSQAALPSNTA